MRATLGSYESQESVTGPRSSSPIPGHDPGEPHNLEDVRIRVFPDKEHAILTFRGRGTEIEVPITNTPSWFDLKNKDTKTRARACPGARPGPAQPIS